jgi:hypothetical protein
LYFRSACGLLELRCDTTEEEHQVVLDEISPG